MVGEDSYYCALFPRAWTVYKEPDPKLRATCRQVSPVSASLYSVEGGLTFVLVAYN